MGVAQGLRFVLGNNSPWAWVLSVVFLVFTLRSVLFKPFMKQMNSQMKMQAVAPELKKLREKYKDDKTRLAEEMQKFNKEAGVNPLGGCLPALIQAPVFIGLFHVLRSFKPGWGQVYFFGASDVQSFVDSKLFGGAPLSSFMTQPWVSTAKQIGLGPDGLNGIRSTVIAVGIPLTILAGIATFLTSRRSVARQQQLQGDNEAAPQAAIMNKLMKYVFPLFVVIGGPFFPLAILFYWLSNNTWTFGQLYVAHRIQDKKMLAESKVVEEAKEAAKFTKPAPGAKPRGEAVARWQTGPTRRTSRARCQTSPGSRPTGGPSVRWPSLLPSPVRWVAIARGTAPDDGSSRVNGSGGPSLSKNGSASGNGNASVDTPPGTVSGASTTPAPTSPKPRPAPTTAKKKKPGQR